MMKRAWSEHRNATTAPKSSGRPSTPVGTAAAAAVRSPPCMERSRSVAWEPGCTRVHRDAVAGHLEGQRLEEAR